MIKLYKIITPLLLIFILLLAQPVFSQIIEKDSTSKGLAKFNNNSKKNELLGKARYYKSTDREKAIGFYSEALRFENTNFEKAVLLDTIGLFNWQLGNYEEALQYFNKALSLFSELKDTTWLGKINNNIAVANWGLGNSNEALKYYFAALDIRKAENDERGVSNILNNIGQIYRDWGLYDEAMQYHKDALEIALKISDINATAYSYSNIGDCFENSNDLATALKYYELGFKILLEKDKHNRSNSFFSAHIGEVYRKMNQLDSALFYFEKSYNYAHRINNLNRITIAEYNLGRIYFQKDKLDSAFYFINRSYEHSIEKNYSTLKKDNLFILSKLEEKQGNPGKALKYLQEASVLKDSLFNREKILKLNDLQIKYNMEQQLNENLLLRKNNEIQEVVIQKQKSISLILIISGIVILIVLFLIIRNAISLKKLSVKLEQSEKELLAANAAKDKFFTIIAHDMRSPFNGFIGITEILATQFDKLSPVEIKEMIIALNDSSLKFYALLESLLQWARIQTGKMQFRFENIDLYLKINDVKDLLTTNALNKNITIINRVAENTSVFADSKTVETVLRNIISNAVKFTNSEGLVTIESELRAGEVVVSVTDNGVGMTEKIKNSLFRIDVNHTSKGTKNELGTGIGLILCKELIEKNGGTIQVESEHNKGSKFIFTLPAKK